MNKFNSTKYQFSHGKKPDGRVYGAWAFEITDDKGQSAVIFVSGKLAAAKQQALEWAKQARINKPTFEILP